MADSQYRHRRPHAHHNIFSHLRAFTDAEAARGQFVQPPDEARGHERCAANEHRRSLAAQDRAQTLMGSAE